MLYIISTFLFYLFLFRYLIQPLFKSHFNFVHLFMFVHGVRVLLFRK